MQHWLRSGADRRACRTSEFDDSDGNRDWQRLDKWLWCARFLKGRSDCSRFVSEGLVRVNRQPTSKPHTRLRVGDVVTIPLGAGVRVVRVLALAERRGRPADARLLYQEIVERPPETPATMACVEAESPPYRRP